MYPKELRRYLKSRLRDKRLTRGCVEKFNSYLLLIAEQVTEQLRSSEYHSIMPQDIDKGFAPFFASSKYKQRFFAVKTIIASLQSALAEASARIESLEGGADGR